MKFNVQVCNEECSYIYDPSHWSEIYNTYLHFNDM